MNNNTDLHQLVNKLRQHLEVVPSDINALADLAGVLAQSGQTEQALAILLPATQQHPQHLGLQHNLAELYRNTGEIKKAEALFTHLITEQPYFIPAYSSLILILTERLKTVQMSQEQRAAILSQLAILSNNKGNALLETGQIEFAKAAYSEALTYWQDYPSAHSNLSNVSRMMGQLSEAEVHARKALALRPDFAEAWNNLGTALSEQGRFAEAISCYQQALAVNPNQQEAKHNAGSGSLFLLLYRDDLTAEQIVDAHRQWGQQFEPTAPPYPISIPNKLRIGFISGDFREHSVMYFAEPLLEKLNRQQFDIVCYANQSTEDAVTQRIKALPLVWRPVAALSDDALCEQIKHDQIDILIDLSGHSKGHRLYALAKKPAPIMATWLGYSFTTGLPAFDYRISDNWADPDSYANQQHTEQLAYLPCSQFNYRPNAAAPEVNALPALHNGFITFGSLNNMQKLNRSVVFAWSQILLSIPNSRLILHNKLLIDAGVAGRIRGLFEAFGVDIQRLDFRPFSVYHLKTYHEIDIALDTFPYNGATTSCEALWMGVPVLSLAGDSSVSRMGVSILSAIGLESWIANSVAEYVSIAQQHSESLNSLAALRLGLRNQLLHSCLCDEERFATDFAHCLVNMVKQKNLSNQLD
jgi:predicted O-linked N-acetylglucosamine transferase (SPINDLY family)